MCFIYRKKRKFSRNRIAITAVNSRVFKSHVISETSINGDVIASIICVYIFCAFFCLFFFSFPPSFFFLFKIAWRLLFFFFFLFLPIYLIHFFFDALCASFHWFKSIEFCKSIVINN